MIKRASIAIVAICLCMIFLNCAFDIKKPNDLIKMRLIQNTNIPGAPLLSQPELLTGTRQPIRIDKHGLLYPVFFDWNKDGKKDLMLGEFETGETGSNIKVYLNEGSEKTPSFTGDFFYATDVNGDTITNHQWCCIGIHPRIVDMNDDGYPDLLSGQYNPGLISMWKGSPEGFRPREFIPQEGYVKDKQLKYSCEPWNPEANSYWNYTSVDFADFNNDGLKDVFIGGTDGFRVALNVGTKEEPAFGLRKYLYHVNGDRLNIEKPSEEEIKVLKSRGQYPNMSGVHKGYITPIDWDNDGVLDLLVTHEYDTEGHNAIEFFRGVNTDKGLRFMQGKPLFTEKGGRKAMPGCQPMITVTDYNNDGIKDIIMGLSIPTVNSDEIALEIAWRWIEEMGIEMPGKDAGRNIKYAGGLDSAIKEIETDTSGFKRKYYMGNLEDYKYLTLRHRGYVFVFYGQKNKEKAIANKINAWEAVKNTIIKNEQSKTSKLDGPVNYSIIFPERINYKEEMELMVEFKLEDDWYLYSDNTSNIANGFIPTMINVDFDYNKVQKLGDIVKPEEQPKGGMFIYNGDKVGFIQKFKLNRPTREEYQNPDFEPPTEINVKVGIKFQSCNSTMCLPPQEVTESLEAIIHTF